MIFVIYGSMALSPYSVNQLFVFSYSESFKAGSGKFISSDSHNLSAVLSSNTSHNPWKNPHILLFIISIKFVPYEFHKMFLLAKKAI